MPRTTLEVVGAEALGVGAIATREAESLFAKSEYGQIVLVIREKRVVESECVVRKHYDQNGKVKLHS